MQHAAVCPSLISKPSFYFPTSEYLSVFLCRESQFGGQSSEVTFLGLASLLGCRCGGGIQPRFSLLSVCQRWENVGRVASELFLALAAATSSEWSAVLSEVIISGLIGLVAELA